MNTPINLSHRFPVGTCLGLINDFNNLKNMQYLSNRSRINTSGFAFKAIFAITLCTTSGQIVQAQSAQPYTTLKNPMLSSVPQQPPYTVPEPGMPPPIGDGITPAPIFPGDTQLPAPVGSGQADPGSGTNFPTVAGDTYKAPILVKGSRRGETLMQFTEQHDYPNVKYIMIQGKRYQYIDRDSPAIGNPKKPNNWIYGGLPTVQVLSRYLIMIAVVVATILMAFAAFGMVLGEENAGARVIRTAGGFMLLLMAFTIWKIILANLAGLNDAGPWDASSNKLPPQILLPDPAPRQELPQVPTTPPRSGLPVYPDSGN